MTDQIKISEVSDILRKELEGINTSIQLEEVGTWCGSYLRTGQR